MAASGYGVARLDEPVERPDGAPWNCGQHPELWNTGHLLELVTLAMEQLPALALVGER